MAATAATAGAGPAGLGFEEDITVDQDHEGDITCRNLVIEAGVRLKGTATAEHVMVHGSLQGLVRAVRVDIAPEGGVGADLRAEIVRVHGACGGLLVVDRFLAARGSRVEGQLIADEVGQELGSEMRATVRVHPGATRDLAAIEAARRALAAQRTASARPAAPVAAVPAAPAPVVQPRPVAVMPEPVPSAPRPVAPAPVPREAPRQAPRPVEVRPVELPHLAARAVEARTDTAPDRRGAVALRPATAPTAAPRVRDAAAEEPRMPSLIDP